MTVVEHLSELRYRLMVSIAAVAVGAIICFIFASPIIGWFLDFYRNATNGRRNHFIFTGPIDAFATRIKVATYGGIVLAAPVWLWQLWRFITPGLNPKEKRYAVPFLISSIVLFLLGGVVALLTLEPALNFLLGAGGDNLKPLLTADKFLSLVSLMIVAFGMGSSYRAALIESVCVTNAALAAHTLQQELTSADREVRAAYGVYVIDERRIWAPRAGSAAVDTLAYPPVTPAEFDAFAQAVVRAERIGGMLS